MAELTCEHCGKILTDQNGLFNHMKAKHPKAKRAHLKPISESSLGQELAEALIAYTAGESVPEYLVSMFPDQFEEARRLGAPR